MPEIPLSRVVSVTSEDPRFPAQNLLHPDVGGRWRSGSPGEKRISVELEWGGEGPLHSLHIGNDGAAFVEALVGSSAGGEFQVLLPTASFMTPGESRGGVGTQRVRIFGPEKLVLGVGGGAGGGGVGEGTTQNRNQNQNRTWNRLRLVCSQPYNTSRCFGLAFVRLFSAPQGESRRLGPFTLRGEGRSPQRPPGASFYQRPPLVAPPQPPPGPSFAAAALESPKRCPSPPAPPPPRSRGSGSVLGGVVLVLSGFQNPLRTQIREAALELGAQYRTQWDPQCSHLVCAFPQTPKAAQVRALGGLLVRPEWIWECQRQQRRVPCREYLLEGSASPGSEEEEPDEAPPPPSPAPQAPPPVTSDPAGAESGESEGSDGGSDPYGGSTEENSDEEEEEEEEAEPLPPLPDFFEAKTFFFHGNFPAGEGKKLQRFVIAFGGTVSPHMSEAVTHVVTSQDWDPTFQEALLLSPSLTFVRPRWVLLCGEKERALPPHPYALRPPA